MIHAYTPEMGQKEPKISVERIKGHLKIIELKPIEMKLSIGHSGNYFVDTEINLKGRGIKLIQDHYINIKGECIKENTYKVTSLALEGLKQKYDMKMECLLD